MKIPVNSRNGNKKTQISNIKYFSCLKYNIVTHSLLLCLLLFPSSITFASQFNIDAAGKAMFNPIISFIEAWYGAGIFASGVGGAVVASGDLRTRALGFGIGSVIAGLTLLGVKAGFDVKTVMIHYHFA
ncbi:MAG UNVERIFIED_CONTAM: hypothetical protein LVQ98_01380 [Rickettsiaceae bacterium]|jgi:hypothetical protein